jgi:membrane-bound serine protease (ClpP class)
LLGVKALIFLLFCGWTQFAGAAAEQKATMVVPLHGEISQAQFFFLRRAVKEAERTGAGAVILEIDTYGGELRAATRMLDALFKTSVPTISFINTNAGSAGALVALSTRQIYMAPVSAIGAAAPVMSGGEDLPTTMNDKIVSYFSGYFRSAAEKNGFNPDIAEAFINKEKEVKIGDTVLHPKGSLLTLSAQEAVKLINGKPMLAAGVAGSVEEIANKIGSGPVRRIDPTGFERLAFWVTALAPLFLVIGILGAYLEFKMHGTFIPGTIAVIAFLIFFLGHYLAGLAGWEVFALFAVGVALVLGELLVHPGTILPGVTGAMLVGGALLWAMIDRYPSQSYFPTAEMLISPLLTLAIAIVIAVVLIAILAKYLPKTSLYSRLVLTTANARGPSFSTSGLLASPEKLRVGSEGIARTVLRPSGNAEFGDLVLDVVTRGEFITPGTRLRVLAVEGSRIVVEELK